MKIIRASVSGFLGIDKADILLGHVNIFFGPNGVGKSSVLEALLLPIFGETSRQAKKKDWGYMIRYPAKKAEIFVQVSEQANGSTVQHDLDGSINPKSSSIRGLKTPDLFDRVLLNPLAFFDLPPKIKADLVGDVKLDPTVVHKELADRGVSPTIISDVVSIIMEHRLSGAEKVLEERRLAASRRIIDPGPEPKLLNQGQETALIITSDAVAEWRSNVVSWERHVGALEERLRGAATIPIEQARRNTLRNEAQKILNEINVPELFPRANEIHILRSRILELDNQLDSINQQISFDRVKCEKCGNLWSPKAPELNGRYNDTTATLREMRAQFSSLLAEETEWFQRRSQQKIAEERMKTLDSLPPLPEVNVETLKIELNQAKSGAQLSKDWLQSVERHMTAMAQWEWHRNDAEAAKVTRAHWDDAVKILRDPEFKARLVSDPLAKARERLERVGPEFFGMKIYVDDQLDVHVNGRPWWLMSTAQKLQASVALADAFAYAGGSRILAIDGVDTLVGSFQRKLVMFLKSVKADYDTILLALAIEDEKPPAFTYLEALQLSEGTSYVPLARWFWVHQTPEGVVVTLRREL